MRHLLLLFTVMALAACTKQTYQSYEWRAGEASRPSLSSYEFAMGDKNLSQGEWVQIRPQTHDGLVVESTYLKDISNSAGKPQRLRAGVLQTELALTHIDTEQVRQQLPWIRQRLLRVFPFLRKHPPLKIEPLIVERGGFHEVVWQVDYEDAQGRLWNLRLNKNLEVRSIRPAGSQFIDTSAWVYPKGPLLGGLQEVPLKGLFLEPTLANHWVYVSSQSENKIDRISGPLKFSPDDSRFDQAQVFVYLNESFRWFESRLGFSLPFQLNAEVHVGHPEKTNSAFYYQGRIRLGQGDGEFYQNIPRDPSIVIHESAHAVIDVLAKLPFEGEGGSLNEGFADFFTAMQLGNPRMGEVAYKKAPFRRTIQNDLKVSDKNGGLYHDSGIVSGTLWEIQSEISSAAALKLAMATLNRLVPRSDIEDFGKTLREVSSEKLSVEEKQKVEQILLKRGFL